MMSHKVDDFLLKAKQWQAEASLLRDLLLDHNLEETLKWKQPCYLFGSKNVVIIALFKDYCSLGFFKGALLKNEHGLLTAPGKNSQAVRQLRFTSLQELVDNEAIIRSTIGEAIDLEISGSKIDFKEKSDLVYPEELIDVFAADIELDQAFSRLTPGRKRGYILHFASAKQSATRTNRILACRKKIMDGKGKNECNCGLSKLMPRCDGTHKVLDT